MTPIASPTVLDAVVAKVRMAGATNRNTEVPPAAILWTDAEREWESMLPHIRAVMPELLTFGAWEPASMSGPAIWIACLLAGAIEWAPSGGEHVPVVYLPGVSRGDLRAIESCPQVLRPLAELTYRGVIFSQVNHRDWTIAAMLGAGSGLALDLAEDRETLTTLRTVLPHLANIRLSELQGRRLDARALHDLVAPDFDREVLRWLDDEATARAERTPEEWKLFSRRVQQRLGVDPDRDGVLGALDQLVQRARGWKEIWERFVEAPTHYPRLPALLERAAPTVLTVGAETLPRRNRAEEDLLRKALAEVAAMDESKALEAVGDLEHRHRARRSYVWAALGQAPLAIALESLARMATMVAIPNGGATLDALAVSYQDYGWKVDAAVLDALSRVETRTDWEVVEGVVRAVYLPWLERSADALMAAVGREGYPRPATVEAIATSECVLFADGLRFDLAQALVAALAAHGITVEMSVRWTAFPPVTATAKPSLSPVAGEFVGGSEANDFRPCLRSTGAPLTPDHFQRLMDVAGVQRLSAEDTGVVSGRGWAEFGDIDHHGHEHGARLVRHIPAQLRELTTRVIELVSAGWETVTIVTDHGWLLMPGGLPKRTLPVGLAETRWGRCAALKPTAVTDVQTLEWHWNPEVRIAVAPGIGHFVAATEYAHGGVTLQECLTPVLRIRAPRPVVPFRIDSVQWTRLRCRVKVQPAGEGLRVDLRAKAGDAQSSLAEAVKPVGADGNVSVLAREEADSQAVVVVVLDAEGRVLARQNTTVGGDG